MGHRFNGCDLHINPIADLAADTDHERLIDANALVDASGNGFAGLASGDLNCSTGAVATAGATDITYGGDNANDLAWSTIELDAA